MKLRTYHLFIYLLLLLPIVGKAQSMQQVLIQEYKEKLQKTPLEGVSLTVQNAGSTVSDSHGQLTLQFRTLKAGDVVQVRRVDLSGYEVFNQEAVKQWTISPQKPFNLVLCKSDKFKQLRDQYMRVSSQSYERQFKAEQSRLAALRKENKLQEEAYQQQLAELENNYYEQLDNLENYVDRFARIDLSELSAQEQHLVELVQDGKIEEAIQLYESSDYLSKYTTQVKELHEINQAQQRLAQVESEMLSEREKVQAAISRQVQTYQLAGGRENFRKISSLLKGMVDADTTNLTALWDYCDYCLNQNQFAEGEKYIGMYLRQTTDNKVLNIRACETLGNLYFSMFQFELAEKYLQQAVNIAKEGTAIDSLVFLPHFVEAQCSLHTLYIYINKSDLALQFTEQLREDLEYFFQQDKELWWSKLALFYAEQGEAYFHVNKIEEAESLFVKSYEMSKNDIDITKEILGLSLEFINQFYYNTKQWKKMEPFLLEDLQIRIENYNNNPDQNIRYLLGVYNNLCELYCNLENYNLAHQYLDQAESLLPGLSVLYDDAAISFDKLNLYDAASLLYQKEGNMVKARQYATKCIELYDMIPEEMKDSIEDLYERNQQLLK